MTFSRYFLHLSDFIVIPIHDISILEKDSPYEKASWLRSKCPFQTTHRKKYETKCNIHFGVMDETSTVM